MSRRALPSPWPVSAYFTGACAHLRSGPAAYSPGPPEPIGAQLPLESQHSTPPPLGVRAPHARTLAAPYVRRPDSRVLRPIKPEAESPLRPCSPSVRAAPCAAIAAQCAATAVAPSPPPPGAIRHLHEDRDAEPRPASPSPSPEVHRSVSTPCGSVPPSRPPPCSKFRPPLLVLAAGECFPVIPCTSFLRSARPPNS